MFPSRPARPVLPRPGVVLAPPAGARPVSRRVLAPEDGPPPLSWRHTGAVLGWIALTLLFRRPDSLLRPQFFAEDGIIFFWQAHERGVAALFTPYAGYLHLIPRLFAWAGEALPILWRPAFYNYGALALTLAWAAWLCRHARLGLHGVERAALALALVLVPQGGEVFLTLSNLQWVQAPVLAALVLQRPARTRAQLWTEAAILLVGGLTGPMVIFLLPLFVWRWAWHWPPSWRAELAWAGPAWAAAGVQAWFIAHSERVQFKPVTHAVRPWLKALGFEVPGRLFFGDQVPEGLGNAFWLLTPLLAGAVALLLWRGAAQDGGHRRRLALAGLLTGGIFLAAALRTVAHDPLIFQPLASGSRYYYVPYVMAAWALVLLRGGCPPDGWPRQLAGAMLGLMLLASATRFCAPRQPDFQWARQARQLQAGEATRVQHPALGPEGWYFDVAARRPPGSSPR